MSSLRYIMSSFCQMLRLTFLFATHSGSVQRNMSSTNKASKMTWIISRQSLSGKQLFFYLCLWFSQPWGTNCTDADSTSTAFCNNQPGWYRMHIWKLHNFSVLGYYHKRARKVPEKKKFSRAIASFADQCRWGELHPAVLLGLLLLLWGKGMRKERGNEA